MAQNIIAPPNPPYQLKNIDKEMDVYLKDLYSFNYAMWNRTGGYDTNINTSSIFVNNDVFKNNGDIESDMVQFVPDKKSLISAKIIEIEAYGVFANNANNKRIRIYFDLSVIFDTGLVAFNNSYWHINSKIIRTSQIGWDCVTDIATSDPSIQYSTAFSKITENLYANNIIKITSKGGASNDIIQNGLIISIKR